MKKSEQHLPLGEVYQSMANPPALNGQSALDATNVPPPANGTGCRDEANLRDFFENGALPLHWVGPDGIILWANQAELNLLGYAREEYIGHHISQFHADEPVIADILNRLTSGETLRDYAASLRCKDGSTRHVLINSSVLFEDGKFVHTRCFTHDITERKRAEERLQERSRLDLFAAEIGKHLIEAGDLTDMLRRCTQTMVDRLDVAFARLWTLNNQAGQLELQASSGIYTHIEGAHASVPLGSFKIGRIGAERKPHLTNQVVGDPAVPEQEWVKREGMVAFAGYPMIVDDRLVGVIAMFSRHALSDITLEALERVASQIALGVERKRGERALRESEHRLREILEALPAAVYTTDAEGRITMFNRAAVDFSGRTPALGDDSWCVSWKLYWPDGTPLAHDQCPMAIALRENRQVRGYEAVAERPDGTRVNFAPYPTPLHDDTGTLTGAVNMLVDITAHKRAEEALREQTAQFQTLLNEAPLGVYLIDGDFRILELNPTARLVFGNIPDLIGRDFGEIIHILRPSVYADEIVARFRHTLETGEPYIVPERSADPLDKEAREYYEWRINRIPLSEGRYGVVCYFRDISAQVLSRDAIADSEARLRFMAESMPQKIFTATPNGEVDYFNQEWMQFTGLSFEQIKNWGWTQFIHPDDLEENVRLWQRSVDTGEPFKFTHRFRRLDGVYRWHLSRAHAMRDNSGKIAMWIGSNTEIHEHKEREDELRRANADLEQFAYSASHDLQEPIRNISIYGQVLEQRYGDVLDAKAKQYIGFMTGGAHRMELLVKDLLAYSQSAQMPGESSDVDATAALNKALSNLSEAIRESEAVVSHDVLPALRLPEVQLQQLFQNLVGNAIKYRKNDDPPRVHISSQRQGAQWLFSVRDNGIGIAPEYKETVFGIFKRLHTGEKYSGTGMGLAICQKIVQRNSGRIWVESNGVDRGSTFYFSLPIGGAG